MPLYTKTTVTIGNLALSSFQQLKLEETISGHHSFEVILNQSWLSQNGDGLFGQVKDMLGKEIVIEILPELAISSTRDLKFQGIVTEITTGKQDDDMHGHCCIRGFSATILLDDDPNIKAFENKNLKSIVQERLSNYAQNLIRSSVSPKYSGSLEYIVQYKENTWNFIRRLASTYGEWCFYDRNQLVFGEHKPEEISLTHRRDLKNFQLQMGIRPGNQKLQSHEYRGDKTAEADTKSQNTGSLNKMSDHALSVSDSLYTFQGLYKVDQQTTEKAQEELKHYALMQRKSDVSQLVYARGESMNPGVSAGKVIDIKEDFGTSADHGKYFVTSVTHICTGNGNYQNYFTSIPSDAASPSHYPELVPRCEAQSAVVKENFDPDGMGRIRVQFRWQSEGMSPWIRYITPHSGSKQEFYFIPETGEEVWVDFEGGNPELPYVIGSLFNGSSKSSSGNSGNNTKSIRTKSGNSIVFDDEKGSITITDKMGASVVLSGDGSINVSAPDKISFSAKTISINGSEKVDIQGSKGVVVNSSSAGVNVTAKTSLALEGTNEMSLDSKNITAKASNNMTVEGTKTDVSATADLSLTGTVNANVKGGMLNLN